MPNIRLKGLAVKIESTYKTDAAPTVATDSIQVEEHFWNELEYDFLEENLREDTAQEALGTSGLAAPDGRYGHITVSVALKGRAAAFASGNRPEVGPLLRIAGLQETIVTTPGSETATYTMRSTGFESATVWAYNASHLYKLVGCFAQLTAIDLMPGQPGRAVFEIWGVMVADPSAAAIPGTLDYPAKAVRPPNVKNAGFTLNGYDPSDFQSFSLDMRSQLTAKPRGNDPDGHAGYELTQFNPMIATTIDMPTLASFDPYALAKAGTLFAWDIGPIGSTQYNKYTLSGPKGRILPKGVKHVNQDNIAQMALQIRCQNTDEVSPADGFQIQFS